MKAYEQGGKDLAVKVLKEHNLGGGGSTSLMGEWSFIDYSRGKGVSVELGPPAYPRLKVTISWKQVVEYALNPDHQFKAKVEEGVTEEECPRQAFGDYYNCILAYREKCSPSLQELCKQKSEGVEEEE